MKCYHMSGAGNDFMVTDGRELTGDLSQLAKKLCAVTGADGFIAAGESRRADVRMHFYNSDGSRAEMCGNGARCLCRFAYDTGLVRKESMTLETDAGLVPGTRLAENLYRVALNVPTVLEPGRLPGVAYVELGNPGLPHAVVQLEDWDSREVNELRELGRRLRFASAFPKGANVTFVKKLEDDHYRVRTFERGVEDFTLACGTGCGSTVSVLTMRGLCSGKNVRLESDGGTLTVSLTMEEGKVTALLLQGPTCIVTIGETVD